MGKFSRIAKFFKVHKVATFACTGALVVGLGVGGFGLANAIGYQHIQDAQNAVLAQMTDDGNLSADQVQELVDSGTLGEEIVDPNTGETVVLTQNADGSISKTVVKNADGSDTGATVPENHTDAPVVDSHTHNWIPQYGTRTVTYQTGTEQVCVQAAYDEPVYSTTSYSYCCCNICGCKLCRTHNGVTETLVDCYTHMITNHPETCGGGGTYNTIEYERVQTGTTHHDAVYESRPTYGTREETYITGYVCSGCGATQ